MKQIVPSENEITGKRPRRSRYALFFSVVSLIVSVVGLYHSVLKEPQIKIYPGCTWQYRRMPGSNDEVFVVPVTLANDGARGGVTLAATLSAVTPGGVKSFDAKFVAPNVNENNTGLWASKQLFAPQYLAPRTPSTATLLFVQRTPREAVLIDREGVGGEVEATIQLKTSLDLTLGFLDRFLVETAPAFHAKFKWSVLDARDAVDGAAYLDICG